MFLKEWGLLVSPVGMRCPGASEKPGSAKTASLEVLPVSCAFSLTRSFSWLRGEDSHDVLFLHRTLVAADWERAGR